MLIGWLKTESTAVSAFRVGAVDWLFERIPGIQNHFPWVGYALYVSNRCYILARDPPDNGHLLLFGHNRGFG
jgi:hypothetical protein